MAWNESSVELLKKLWEEGLSASQIAECLNGVTPAAVIGKVHRLGLSGRTPGRRERPHKPQQPKTNKVRGSTVPRNTTRARFTNVGNPALRTLYESAEPYVETQEELAIPIKERKHVGTLETCSCRWPIGDPQKPGFHFCGKQKVDGLPYCEFHALRAYQPPSVTRSRQEQAEKAFEER